MDHRIKIVRENAKVSRTSLAERIGLTRRTLYNFESGNTSPRLCDLQNISRALGVRLGDLLFLDDHQTHSAA